METLRISAVVALAALAACSGGGGSALTPGAPAAVQSGTAGGSRATLTIVVPRATGATTSAKRMPRYVSPASANLQVTVNGGTAATYGLTPTSPGCALLAGNVSCTFSIAAPAGNDTLALSLIDGAGKVLSRNVVTATVAAGVATPVAVTLAAVPASVVVVPGANAIIDTTAPPYHAPGLSPQPIEVEALDADGNVIIGPGAPTVGNVTVTTGAAYATVASANTTDPAAFLLTPVDGSAGGQTVGVSATVTGIPLADGTTSPPLTNATAYTFTPAIAIASGPFVSMYSLESGQLMTHFRACAGGCPLTIVNGAASDAKGNLYVLIRTFLGTAVNSTINVFPHGLTAPTYSLGSAQGVHASGGLTIDAHGTLYVANGQSGGFKQPHLPPTVTEYAPGATTPSYTIAGTSISPAGIAVDAGGNVFVADSSVNGAIKMYPPASQTPSATLSSPSITWPNALAVDAAGGLYVAGQTPGIAYFAAGQTTPTTLNDASFGNAISTLMLDPSGNLWASFGAANISERLAASALPNAVSITDTLSAAGAMAWIP